jgi:RNA polymerase sigma-70 factor (ECF subfamily)
MEPSDRELMARLAAGDREALGPLVERHHVRLYRIALAYLRNADDASESVQETFVKVCVHAARWDPASEVGPWLTRIAINEAIDRYRYRKRRTITERPLEAETSAFAVVGAEVSPERHALSREIATRIAGALRGLPERQRAVFVLRHYEELSLEEISRALDMSLGTVKSSLHRALGALRRRLAVLAP